MKVGTDIVEVARISKMAASHPDFLQKAFTAEEQQYIQKKHGRPETIAGLFAGKEAIAKAVGTGIGRLGFQDMEIGHSPLGQPWVHFSPEGKERLEEAGLAGVQLSISHDKGLAIAVAVADPLPAEKRPAMNFSRELNLSLLKRDRRGYKTQYGKVALIGGSRGMVGSVCLAAQAALRTGAGLVYAVVPSGIADLVQGKLLEAIVRPVDDGGRGCFSRDSLEAVLEAVQGCDCLAVGPGMGRDPGLPAFLAGLLERTAVPLVIDADGLNALAHNPAMLEGKRAEVVLTPHEMEMSRISGLPLDEVRGRRAETAMSFASRYGVKLLLKGADTIITDGEVYYLNNTGNPGMATAGSGDVLTGITAGLLGYGYPAFLAARLACYLHGLAGDFAAADKGEDGLIAGDLVYQLPYVMKCCREQEDAILEGEDSYRTI